MSQMNLWQGQHCCQCIGPEFLIFTLLIKGGSLLFHELNHSKKYKTKLNKTTSPQNKEV